MRPEIEIHIEELVLSGVDAGSEAAIADAVIRSLSGAFAGDLALPAADLWLGRLDAGQIGHGAGRGAGAGRGLAGQLGSAVGAAVAAAIATSPSSGSRT